MSRYLILAQSAQAAAVLRSAWLPRLAGGLTSAAEAMSYVWDGQAGSPDLGLQRFNDLQASIQAVLEPSGYWARSSDVVALVDSISADGLNAVGEGCDWDHLIGLLILTFPEIRWLFGRIDGVAQGLETQAHLLSQAVVQAPREPLLDPTGLRNFVRRTTNLALNQAMFGIAIPGRAERACAIDEERNYALFNGYTAYRYGFLADAIFSWRLMQERFTGPAGAPGTHGYHLLLEDMSLHFPDRPSSDRIASLADRGALLPRLSDQPGLETSYWRVLITSGEDGAGATILTANQDYLKRYKSNHWDVVYKPVGGMLDLWQRAHQRSVGRPRERAGNAGSFHWPVQAGGPSTGADHGAPGKLMLLAEILIGRAERLSLTACSLSEFICGAVYAGDAAELLCGRTPTLALAAVALKHEFEIKAECAFMGAGANFQVERRLEEIRLEVAEISRAYTADVSKTAKLNALTTIYNRIALVFRDKGQFDEEEACMAALRCAHRSLSLLKNRKRPLAFAFSAVLGYAESIMSLQAFWVAIAAWVGILGFAWWAADCGHDAKAAFVGIGSAFFGGNFTDRSDTWPLAAISGVAVIAGFFHLGVFISYLYSRVARR